MRIHLMMRKKEVIYYGKGKERTYTKKPED